MRILFLCTGNSARSQMADGFAKAYASQDADIWSAGSRPSAQVDPRTVKVMSERGIDISHARPKHMSEVPSPMDVYVAVCSEAAKECPAPIGSDVERWHLPDPVDEKGDEEQMLEVFRATREEVEKRVVKLLEERGLLARVPE